MNILYSHLDENLRLRDTMGPFRVTKKCTYRGGLNIILTRRILRFLLLITPRSLRNTRRHARKLPLEALPLPFY